MGVRPDGTKELIAVEDGYRESTDSRSSVLRSLRDRPMRAPTVVVGDGALGFWVALREVWPETKEQRCWFHKMGNVTGKRPKRLALQLGKDVELTIRGADTIVDPDIATPLLRNLPHLLRNALDHGIEDVGERGNKKSKGEIEELIASTEDTLEVSVSDDGRGIDVDRLVRQGSGRRGGPERSGRRDEYPGEVGPRVPRQSFVRR